MLLRSLEPTAHASISVVKNSTPSINIRVSITNVVVVMELVVVERLVVDVLVCVTEVVVPVNVVVLVMVMVVEVGGRWLKIHN